MVPYLVKACWVGEKPEDELDETTLYFHHD